MCACALTTYAKTKTLNIGDPAPIFKVGKWYKGDPITGLKRGKVYVVEFWATRCPPCVAGIPHLSALAHHYKKTVTVTGISVQKWQDGSPNDDRRLVADFMKSANGQKMKYNVAVDTTEGGMVKSWLGAAGFDSIPCAFVVGKDGRIAYMGDPAGLDTILARIASPNGQARGR